MSYSIGDQFVIHETNEVIKISSIKERDDKNKKMADPVYFLAYSSSKPQFSTYAKEISRMVSFGRWRKVNKPNASL